MDDDSLLGCVLTPVLFVPRLFEGALRALIAALEGIAAAGRWVQRRLGMRHDGS